MIKFFIFFVLVGFDLLSKKIVFDSIDLHTFIPLTFFLDLTHIHNFGIAFGLLSGLISPWILIILGLLVVAFIFYLMKSASDTLEEWGLLIIISGAISNIIDRIFNGYVIDFIYFHYKAFFWPAFNFADIYITFGVLIIFYQVIMDFKNKKNDGK